ncbi:MAG TPA: SusC/RagA family TonB-linked outer membrane protein [Hanamia sp.]
MKKLFSLIAIIAGLITTALAQKTISGKVYDKENHLPLRGVTVGTASNSVTTDSTGFFSLRVEKNTSLILLSHIGYSSLKLPVNEIKANTFYLEPHATVMDEVIVSNGYQQLPKEKSTGSFDKIDNNLINRSTSSNILDRLQGITNGLFFSKVSGTNNLYIRGLSTIKSGASTPLIILNNFPYNGSIDQINPNDVESITILKDAAAASIWGASAGNGVIVITTKKANYQQPTRVSFSSIFTTEDKPDLFKDKNFMSSSDFIDVEKFLFSKGFYNSTLTNTYTFPVVSPVVEILAQERNGMISEAKATAEINALSNYDIRSDYLKYLYRNASTQQYSLGLSGGSRKINYLVNAGLDKNQLPVIGDGNQRNTLYTSINLKPLTRLEISTSITYTDLRSTNNGISSVNPGSGKANIYPYARLAYDNGNPLVVTKDHRSGYIDTVGNGLLKDWHYIPLDEINNQDIKSESQNFLFNLALKYHFTKSLAFQVQGQYEKINNINTSLYNGDSYYARNLINMYTSIVNNVLIRHIPDGGILDKTFANGENYNFRALINYNLTTEKDNQLSILAGGEVRENLFSSQSDRVYGYNDNLLTFSNVDYTTDFDITGSFASNSIPFNTGFAGTDNRFLSLFANGAYTFKKKLVFSGSLRKDASNLFGVNANQKWNPFWSTGVAWKLSNESFYRLEWLPSLKFRITYGYSGNIDNTLSALAIIHYSPSSRVTNLPFAYAKQPSNPDLQWERTGTINYGMDFATAKNRLSGSLEYYIKRSSDLFVPVHIDPTLGTPGSLLTKNAGSLITKGFDFKLNSSFTFNKIRWQAALLLSYVRSKVTSYKFDYSDKKAYISTGYVISPLEGQDPYAIVCYKWAGLEHATGDPQGYLDGKVSKDYYHLLHPTSINDLVIKGTARPPYFGSFINSFYFNRFGLSANINFKWGYNFMVSALQYNNLYNYWSMNSQFPDRWQKPGDEARTNVPSMPYPSNIYRDQFYNNAEVNVDKGDNIRLQDIRLSYDFLFSRQKKTFKELEVFFYMNNVGILWRANHEGLDPDYGFGLPSPRTYSLGIKANF